MFRTIGYWFVFFVIAYLVLFLPVRICAYLDDKRFANDYDEDLENHYTIRPPSYLIYLGIVTGLLSLFAFFMATFVTKEWVGVLFLPIVAACGFLALYTHRWKIEVRGHKLIVYQLGKSPRAVDMGDLDRIVLASENLQGTLTGYQNGKKQFKVEAGMIGYDKLGEYFQANYMITSSPETEKNAFRISRGFGEKFIAICTIMFGFGCALGFAFSENEMVTPFVLSFFLLFGMAGICMLIVAVRWKIVVEENTFTYCTAFGRETSIQVQDIERVEFKKHALALIHNGKTIIKVEFNLKNLFTLIERLKSENTPFYKNNEQIDYTY